MSLLLQKKCIPCEGGASPMDDEAAQRLLQEVPGWELQGKKIARTFTFKNFKETMAFVNRVADLAEEEGHHPDMGVHWGRVDMEFWTHVIDGLSKNDFIMAAKVNALVSKNTSS